jgi:outer membrane protein assembly factor BamB
METVKLRYSHKKDLIEILVNNIIKICLILFFVASCSFHKNSRFWSNEKISQENEVNKIEILEKEEEPHKDELNPNLRIKVYSKVINNNTLQVLDNNDGRVNYNGKLENISKYKFKKIENFHQYEYEITSNQSNIIFFDNEGSILNFDNNSNLVWSKNHYSKSEIKQQPKLFFAHNGEILIIADNIAKLYALNIKTGELIWSKNNNAPYNSQIKIYKNNFYIIDFENTLGAYSLNDGREIWENKTQKSLIRSQKKLSLVIKKEVIYFNNSLGDITAVDANSGNLIWQTPTQKSLAYDTGFYLKTSEIVMDKNTLFFSNNQNQFFSIDSLTGNINWKQEINSSLRAIVINDFIFTVSLEGYLIIIEKKSGNIVRINDIFKGFKTKKRHKIKPSGFIVGTEKIYVSTDNGRLLVVEISTGKIRRILKIDNRKISRPAVINKNLYFITENSIIKLD